MSSTTSHPPVSDSIAARLRARIEEAYGGNQRAFATAMGLSPQHVSAMLSGKIALPRPEVRRTLARELGMTHGEFLVLAGELEPDEIVIQHRPLPSDEAELVRLYRGLPLATRNALLAIARELAAQFAQRREAKPGGHAGTPNGVAPPSHSDDGDDGPEPAMSFAARMEPLRGDAHRLSAREAVATHGAISDPARY